ncbi:hypothetical protein [Emticicia agri]|uniref:Uncharacterized protein n=1 Tax=Emticicia agri TaxID=2492393 RepID=A0A4Q5LW50_9BACT|nr:hypothetical protein [Emticicia agri]RYU93986.1 hypothetical protein EWM59_19090 [Emticicia agri]
MKIIEEIEPIIAKIESLHLNDLKVYEYWDQLIEILGRDEEETIRFFKEIRNENIISHLCGQFPEISGKLQSDRLIVTLEELDKRFPHLKIAPFIQGAIEWLSHDYPSKE